MEGAFGTLWREVFVTGKKTPGGAGKKTPGGAGTHTGHTGTDGHTDHTDEPHNHPNPTTHPHAHDHATAEVPVGIKGILARTIFQTGCVPLGFMRILLSVGGTARAAPVQIFRNTGGSRDTYQGVLPRRFPE